MMIQNIGNTTVRTAITYDYRKCYRCRATTEDMTQSTCKCGGYMYIMGSVWTTRVKTQEQTNRKGVC